MGKEKMQAYVPPNEFFLSCAKVAHVLGFCALA
jgi:hypothetical protein